MGGGDVGDNLLGPGVEPFDLGSEAVDLAKQNVGELGVMLVEAAGERLNEGGILDPQPSFGQLGEYVGSRSPAIMAASMARQETPMMLVATDDSLIRASSSSFSTRWMWRDRSPVRSARSRV